MSNATQSSSTADRLAQIRRETHPERPAPKSLADRLAAIREQTHRRCAA